MRPEDTKSASSSVCAVDADTTERRGELSGHESHFRLPCVPCSWRQGRGSILQLGGYAEHGTSRQATGISAQELLYSRGDAEYCRRGIIDCHLHCYLFVSEVSSQVVQSSNSDLHSICKTPLTPFSACEQGCPSLRSRASCRNCRDHAHSLLLGR